MFMLMTVGPHPAAAVLHSVMFAAGQSLQQSSSDVLSPAHRGLEVLSGWLPRHAEDL